MGRAPCCDKANVKKGPWSPEEDLKLKQFIEKYGTGGNWIALPHKAGLKRCGKSCRLRWLNYLRPNIKHGEFSDDEDRIICTLYASIGSRWSIIAAQLPGRTDNDIKNYWNTKLKKKLMAASVMPFSHTANMLPQPPFSSSLQTSTSSSSISYKGTRSTTTNYYNTLTNQELPFPLMPSNLLSNHKNTTTTTTSSLLQVQNSSLMGPMQQFLVKNSPQHLFGVGGDQPASCSSSDGSCNQFSYGSCSGGGGGPNNGEQMGFEGYFYNNGVDEWSTEKQNGFLGETPLEYNFEEMKTFMTSSSSSSILLSSHGNVCNNFFKIDETKTQGKVMY